MSQNDPIKQKIYRKIFNSRPENKLKAKLYQKRRYQIPEVRDKFRFYQRRSRSKSKQNYLSNFLTIQPTRRYINEHGYVLLRFNTFGVAEHIHKMRVHIGKCFNGKEYEVHHKNGIRTDNRIENLELIPVYGIHSRHRIIDELHKSLKTISQQDQEIARLKEIIETQLGQEAKPSC